MVRFVYVTCRDKAEALEIGRGLVKERLASCVNVWGGMTSVYVWKGQLEESGEAVLLVKTFAAKVDAVMARVKEKHSYEVPCMLVWEIEKGHPPFVEWMRAAIE
jgi:periplasmic divalent cation tolerance protein